MVLWGLDVGLGVFDWNESMLVRDESRGRWRFGYFNLGFEDRFC